MNNLIFTDYHGRAFLVSQVAYVTGIGNIGGSWVGYKIIIKGHDVSSHLEQTILKRGDAYPQELEKITAQREALLKMMNEIELERLGIKNEKK